MKDPIARLNYGDTTGNGYPDLREYKWRVRDFENQDYGYFQALINGAAEGMFRGAVLTGLDLTSTTGLNFTVLSGAAVGPSGNLMVLYAPTTGALPSPTAAAGARHLVVLRPGPDVPSGYITKPTDPGESVPLLYERTSSLVVLDGSGGNYPTPATGDVVLFAVRLANGASSFTDAANVSRQERDLPGKQSSRSSGQLGGLPLAFDQRLLVYRSATAVVGIKPSQGESPFSRALSFLSPTSGLASKFPLSGGLYNGAAGDTFLNFTTGAISGADATSSAITPTIPASNTFIWALLMVSPSAGTLSVAYGTQGTYAQCQTALRNQTAAGAGGIPTSSTGYRLALVLLGSSNGTAITELDVYDVRSFNPTAVGRAVFGITTVTGPATLVMTGDEEAVEIDATGGDVTITLPDLVTNAGKVYSFDRLDGTLASAVVINRKNSDTIAEPDNTTSYPMDTYQSQSFFASTAKWKVRG